MSYASNQVTDLMKTQLEGNCLNVNGDCFSGYKKGYLWSNENVAGAIDILGCKAGDKVLSILASGDQAFNMIFNGVKEIDTFDINCFSEYLVFGLKIPMILKYDYKAFLENTLLLQDTIDNPNLICQFIYDLFPYMDKKYRTFWKNIVDNYRQIICSNRVKKKIPFLSLFNLETFLASSMILRNNYLKDENSYNQFKHFLQQSNIHFKVADAKTIFTTFESKYDLIYLSNVLDYFHNGGNFKYRLGKINLKDNSFDNQKLVEYEQKLANLLNDNGIIMLDYLFCVDPIGNNDNDVVINDAVYYGELDGEEIIRVPSIKIDNIVQEDSMLLVRKKNIKGIKL